MKKSIFKLTALTLFSAFVITACKKPDVTAPVITLNGNASEEIALREIFTDPGATATDNKDGDISSKIEVDGNIDNSTAGAYAYGYDVTDEAGNDATTVVRNIFVVIKGATMAATYSVQNNVGSSSSSYVDDITVSSSNPSKILVSKFASYNNGGVYMMISDQIGTTVTVPQQTVICGTPANSRTFSGTGTISTDGKYITVNYTETTNGNTVSGTEQYSKQ